MAKQRNYSIKDITTWKFKELSMPPEWVDHLGDITENFRMLVVGKSGHGKTEYVMQLSKMLSEYYGKVSFNSTEQGKSASLKNSFVRNKMNEIKGGKWMLADPSQRIFENWFARLKKQNSGRVIILDSLDYMKLTIDQYKKLHETFKHKSFIIVAWNDPIDANTKKIRYMCDIKVEVENYTAKIASRFGGNKPWKVWDQTAIAGVNDREVPTSLHPDNQFRKVKHKEKKKNDEVKELIRTEVVKYPDGDKLVLIYEDQPEKITVEDSHMLFAMYPEVDAIHELNEKWGGRWIRGKGQVTVTEEEHAQEVD